MFFWQNTRIYFEYVDFWPKVILYLYLGNSTTQIDIMAMSEASRHLHLSLILWCRHSRFLARLCTKVSELEYWQDARFYISIFKLTCRPSRASRIGIQASKFKLGIIIFWQFCWIGSFLEVFLTDCLDNFWKILWVIFWEMFWKMFWKMVWTHRKVWTLIKASSIWNDCSPGV